MIIDGEATAASVPVMDPTLLAVLSIFGGAALTAIAGWIASSIQARREQHRWLREKRLAAYQNILEFFEELTSLLGKRRLDKLEEESYFELLEEYEEHDEEQAEILAVLETFQSHAAKDLSEKLHELEQKRAGFLATLELFGPTAVVERFDQVLEHCTSEDIQQYALSREQLEHEMRLALRLRR